MSPEPDHSETTEGEIGTREKLLLLAMVANELQLHPPSTLPSTSETIPQEHQEHREETTNSLLSSLANYNNDHQDTCSTRSSEDDRQAYLYSNEYLTNNQDDEYETPTKKRKKWDAMFHQLEAYFQEHHDCRVPKNYDKNIQLGRWVQTQRKAYRVHKLSQERIDRLEALGFSWNARFDEPQWNRSFEKLKAGADTKTDPQLAKWADWQRRNYKLGKLSRERICKLESIGFRWSRRYNTTSPPNGTTTTSLPVVTNTTSTIGIPSQQQQPTPQPTAVARIVTNPTPLQVTMAQVDTAVGLSPPIWPAVVPVLEHHPVATKPQLAAVSDLETTTTGWDVISSTARHQEPVLPHTEAPVTMWGVVASNPVPPCDEDDDHKVVSPPSPMSVPNKTVPCRLPHVRVPPTLPPPRMAPQLPPPPHVAQQTEKYSPANRHTYWNSMYERLTAFAQEHGHCVVQNSFHDQQLSRWVTKQRYAYKRKELTQYRVDKLNALDFCWDVHNTYWTNMFNALKKFVQEQGHFGVPKDVAEYKQLASWMELQRHYNKIGKITEDRKQKLNDIDFPWVESSQGNPVYRETARKQRPSQNGAATTKRPPSTQGWIAATSSLFPSQKKPRTVLALNGTTTNQPPTLAASARSDLRNIVMGVRALSSQNHHQHSPPPTLVPTRPPTSVPSHPEPPAPKSVRMPHMRLPEEPTEFEALAAQRAPQRPARNQLRFVVQVSARQVAWSLGCSVLLLLGCIATLEQESQSDARKQDEDSLVDDQCYYE